ncbi:hypothetical protein ACIBAG_15270 [Streptomyces sp. NPDC051243]
MSTATNTTARVTDSLGVSSARIWAQDDEGVHRGGGEQTHDGQ